MHLFTLLLAAVFSSSFKAINDEWTLTISEIDEVTDTIAPVIIKPATSSTWIKGGENVEKITFHLSLSVVDNPEEEEFPIFEEVTVTSEANGEGDFETTNVDIQTLNLVGVSEIFMDVSYESDESNTVFDNKYATITVNPAEVFVVDPLTITKLDQIDELTITTTDGGADWDDAKISVRLSHGGVDIEIEVPIDESTSSNDGDKVYKKTNVPLEDFTTLADGSTIVVEASKTYSSPVYLPHKPEIKVEIPTPPGPTTFTISTTEAKFADPFMVPEIDVIPTTTKDWKKLITDNMLTFQFTSDAVAQNDEPKTVKGELTQKGTVSDPTFHIPSTNINNLGLKDDDLPKQLVVQISEDGGDSYLLHKAYGLLKKADVPTPADFTVKPTTIDLRTTTKASITVEQTEQTDKWAEKVYLYFSLKEETPGKDTLQKEAKKTTVDTKDQWTVADLSLSEVTGIDKDKTVYVYVLHGVTEDDEGTLLEIPAKITITKSEEPKPEAAMGVSPFLSVIAALIFLFVSLF